MARSYRPATTTRSVARTDTTKNQRHGISSGDTLSSAYCTTVFLSSICGRTNRPWGSASEASPTCAGATGARTRCQERVHRRAAELSHERAGGGSGEAALQWHQAREQGTTAVHQRGSCTLPVRMRGCVHPRKKKDLILCLILCQMSSEWTSCFNSS
jgi:hypothetical protein